MKLGEFIRNYNPYADERYPKQFTISAIHRAKEIFYCKKDVIENIIKSDYWEKIKDISIGSWHVNDFNGIEICVYL